MGGDNVRDRESGEVKPGAGAEVQAVRIYHQGDRAAPQHLAYERLLPVSKSAAQHAGVGGLKGPEKPVRAVKDGKDGLGHGPGQKGIDPLLTDYVQEPHSAPKGRPGRHNAGPGHAPAAADHQEPPLAALMRLDVKGPEKGPQVLGAGNLSRGPGL